MTVVETGAPATASPEAESRQAQARKLGAIRRRLFLVNAAVGLAYPALFWLSGLSVQLWSWLAASASQVWLSAVAIMLLYLLGETLALLPLSYYSGYVVAHRFGLSRQTPRAWSADWAKATVIGLLLSVVVGLLFFWLAHHLADHWWWVLGLALTAGFAFLGFLAPYVLVPLFYRMQPVQDASLVERLRALLARAEVELHQVCTLDFSRKTAEANAAVIGLGKSRRIVIADTLLDTFTPDEVDSVIAHELGHHVHRDMLRLVVIQSGVTYIALALAHWVGLPLLESLVGAPVEPDSVRDISRLPAALPLIAGAAGVYLLLAMPVVNGFSRAIETSADRFGLALTGNTRAFISAMRKLADQNLVDVRPPAWAELLLASHPSIARRVQMAESWRGGCASAVERPHG